MISCSTSSSLIGGRRLPQPWMMGRPASSKDRSRQAERPAHSKNQRFRPEACRSLPLLGGPRATNPPSEGTVIRISRRFLLIVVRKVDFFGPDLWARCRPTCAPLCIPRPMRSAGALETMQGL